MLQKHVFFMEYKKHEKSFPLLISLGSTTLV